MPFLTDISRSKKINYFLRYIPKNVSILEIGSGSGWVGSYFKANGYTNYVGLDLEGTADVIGDIKVIDSLPFKPKQFDVIIAFEVIEHVDLLEECLYFLKDSGSLMLTTPLPTMDWMCYIFEKIGLNQKRTSPHCNLTNIKNLPGLSTEKYSIVGFMGQWGVYRKLI